MLVTFPVRLVYLTIFSTTNETAGIGHPTDNRQINTAFLLNPVDLRLPLGRKRETQFIVITTG